MPEGKEVLKEGDGYAIGNARSDGQAAVMIAAAKKGECLFCKVDMTVNKPLNKLGQFDPEGKDWPDLWVWENPFSQEYQSHHIVILPKKHIDNINFHEEMTDPIWLQILDARRWACKFYNIPGGGGLDRFGMRWTNAGTIDHWHFQLMIPDGSGNVKGTLFKDLSPVEEARRKNRKTYSKKKLEQFDGFLVFASGYILNGSFHWEKFNGNYLDAYVHTAKALPHIRAIFRDNEIAPDGILPVTFKKGYGVLNPSSYCTQPFMFKGCLEAAKVLNTEAYTREIVIGYVFQDAKGHYLSEDFEWKERDLADMGYVPYIHTEQTYDYVLAAFSEVTVIHNSKIDTDTLEIHWDKEGVARKKHMRRGSNN